MNLYIDNRSSMKIGQEIIEKLKLSIEQCLKVEQFPDKTEISVSLVDDNEIYQLNLQYRQQDSPTDVLSFPLLEEDDDLSAEVVLLGDIVISVNKAKEQAKEYGHSFEREICYLAIHSMFHLFRYDHMTPDDKHVMRAKEKEVINNLKL